MAAGVLRFNDALTVLEAAPHFLVVELCFLAYFMTELAVRQEPLTHITPCAVLKKNQNMQVAG